MLAIARGAIDYGGVRQLGSVDWQATQGGGGERGGRLSGFFKIFYPRSVVVL